MACIYILRSDKVNKFYIGSSRAEDSAIRLNAHNAGKMRSTKSARPWILVHEEFLDSYTDARKRENFLKSGQSRQWIKERWQSGLMRRS